MELTVPEKLCHIREQVAARIGASRYDAWFGDSAELQLDGDRLDITVPNAFVGGWIATNFMPHLMEVARRVIGAEPRVEIRTAARPPGDGDPPDTPPPRPRAARPAAMYAPGGATPAARRDARPTLRGNLEAFVVGPSNDLAYATASAVVRAPGRAVKHLVVHGGCGLGKTHLLQGICNGVARTHPYLEWCYVSGEEFTNEFIYAVKSGRVDLFRARFRKVDVLVIDDIHFLANKKATQEEFLHTFNTIDAGGKTVVLSSDRHPRSISALSEPLVDRLIAATIVEIAEPDFATRREILRRRAEVMGCAPSEAVLDYLARHITRNVRELEGALYKLAAFAALTREPIGLDLAQRALRDTIDQSRPPETAEIERLVCSHFEVSKEALRSKSRDRSVTLARGVAMYLTRKHTTLSFPEIARATGHRNHSTVLMAVRRIRELLDHHGAVVWKTSAGLQEVPLKQVLEELERKLLRGRDVSARSDATG